MEESFVFDLAGIGIGPFNLGLAALCYTIGLDSIFFDKATVFNWHPGMLLKDARLQVPFFADLVTPVDPSNKFSYMAYLYNSKRLFRFAIRDNNFIKRTDYNNYCKWVADQLPNLHFDSTCQEIHFDQTKQCYKIQTSSGIYFSKRIVIGIGTTPYIPSFAQQNKDSFIIHSAEYLSEKNQLLQKNSLAVIGSGQSAAEIIYDILQTSYNGRLDWLTRTDGFIPMDYSSFSLEKTSIDYIDYFYSLPQNIKSSVLLKQNNIYKGINIKLLSDIYNLLDDGVAATVQLFPNCELRNIYQQNILYFTHLGYQHSFTRQAEGVILATGYTQTKPVFIDGIADLIAWDENGKYKVNRNYSLDKQNTIFVQNAEPHTHGHNASDLGLGPYRNATIINTILGYEHFELEQRIAFQHFSL